MSTPLVRNAVDDDRTAVGTGPMQQVCHCFHIVTIHRPEIFQTQIFKHSLRGHNIFDALLHAVEGFVDRTTDYRCAFEHLLAPFEETVIAPGSTQCGEVLGKTADGRRVRTRVVIDHHDKWQIGPRGNVVQRLPRHASGQRTIANHSNHAATRLPLQGKCLGHTIGIRQ